MQMGMQEARVQWDLLSMLLAWIVQRLSDSLLSGADANDGVFHAVWPANPRQGLVYSI